MKEEFYSIPPEQIAAFRAAYREQHPPLRPLLAETTNSPRKASKEQRGIQKNTGRPNITMGSQIRGGGNYMAD